MLEMPRQLQQQRKLIQSRNQQLPPARTHTQPHMQWSPQPDLGHQPMMVVVRWQPTRPVVGVGQWQGCAACSAHKGGSLEEPA